MKQFVLMVALATEGGGYDYLPAVLVDENSCMMLADLINTQQTVLQHAWCQELPRPKARPWK